MDFLKKHKSLSIILGGILLVVGLCIVCSIISSLSSPSSDNVNTNSSTNPTTTITEELKSLDVDVTSQIVKEIDGKYRYFFDIRNNDLSPFEGEVNIELITQSGSNLGEDSFSTNQPIKPGLGTSVYIDKSTGPIEIHSENGISGYNFEVKVDGKVVNSDEGQISSKLEVL
jgi:hypothetical protein